MPAKLKPRTIGVLIFDDFQILDACGPIGAFEMPMRGMKRPLGAFQEPRLSASAKTQEPL